MVGPHVVRVGKSEPLVEPVPGGQELGGVPEVPLALDRGGVAAGLEHLGDGALVPMQSDRRSGAQGALDPDPAGIAAGQQRRPGGRTDRLGRVELGESHPLPGQLIDVRSRDRGAETTHVPVSQIVAENNHDVRWPALDRRVPPTGGREDGEDSEKEDSKGHGRE